MRPASREVSPITILLIGIAGALLMIVIGVVLW